MKKSKKELKLVFDLKYGYDDMYIAARNYIFYLDMLIDKKLIAQLNKIIKEDNLGPEVAFCKNPEDVVLKYSDNPEQLIKDYCLLPIIEECICQDIGRRSFPEVFSDNPPVNFPELFAMRNLRVEYSDDTDFVNVFESHDGLECSEPEQSIIQENKKKNYDA